MQYTTFLNKLLASIFLLGVSASCGAQQLDLIYSFELASEHDAELHAAYNQLLSSKEISPQALADLLPSIDLSASSSDERQESESSFSGGGKSTSQFRTEGFSITLRQPLFNWARIVNYRQAKQLVSKAEVEYLLAEQSLIIRLTERYLDTIQAHATLTVADKDVKAFSRQLEQAKIRFDVGVVAITDMHDAQARYDLSVATQISAQNNVYSKHEALREIIQTPTGDLAPLETTFPLSPPEPNNIDVWEASAAQQNLTLEMARLDVAIAKKQISIHRSGHYPTIDIVAAHNYSETGGGSFGTGFRNESDALGVELKLPIFKGGKTRSLTQQAAFNHQQTLDQLEALQRSTLRETRDAFRGVTSSAQRIKALKQALISNQSSLKASEAGLEVGTRTIVDVLDAQSNVSRIELQLTEAKNNYILNILNLKKTAGTLSKNDLSIVNQWLQH